MVLYSLVPFLSFLSFHFLLFVFIPGYQLWWCDVMPEMTDARPSPPVIQK